MPQPCSQAMQYVYMELLEEQRMINLGLDSEIMTNDYEPFDADLVTFWLDDIWEKLPRGTIIGNGVRAG